jgi:fructose-specific phosphotransferase system IIA component
MKLVDVLKPDYIQIPLKGQNKEEVIKELIQVLTSSRFFSDHNTVFSAIMEREKIMTTGVGREVAIPHCKKKECSEFAIALGIHPEGVDFQSIDNRPVKIIFLLIGPEENPGTHIRLLSRISRIIAKESLRDKLKVATTPDEAYRILKEEEEKYFEIAS